MRKTIWEFIENHPDDVGAVRDYVESIRNEVEFAPGKMSDPVHADNRMIRQRIVDLMRTAEVRDLGLISELYRRSLLLDAPVDFDSYMLYIELDRDLEKRYYAPRRRIIKPLIDSMQALIDDELDLLTISMPPGTGKQLSNDTPVLTSVGWKNHGDLKVGDNVIGRDGKFHKVTRVFPKNTQDCEVTFSNGDVIKCHENHEWIVFDRAIGKERILETKEIEKRTLSIGEENHRGHRYILQIPNHEAIHGTQDVNLFVKPYTFGAWLGDGSNTKPCITGVDNEVLVGVVSDNYLIRNSYVHKTTGVRSTYFEGLRKDLQKFGLCQCHYTVPKYIPEVYMISPLKDRLALLAGLIDTDGTKVSGNKYKYTTCEPTLRDSVVDLISTFGWRSTIIEHKPRVSTSGIEGKKVYWDIQFTPDLEIPCRLVRKQHKSTSKHNRISIVSVKRIEPCEGNCIEVEGGEYLAGKSMILTHNSTAGIFLLTWLMGRFPDKPNLVSGHSGILTRSFYDGALQIITDPEYLWSDVFKGHRVAATNSKEETIDLDKSHRFSTLTCRAINASLTGATRCEGLLYADDLVSGIEEAMSKERMDSLWQKVTNDLLSRMKLGAKQLHVATRWSIHDPIGRLEQRYGDDPRCKFVVAPALNENDESNFDYDYGVGFDTKYFHDMRSNLDDASWKALFMNQPIEREGQLYPESDLRRFFELPDKDPDAVWAVCDTKDRGADYCGLPVAYQYGQDYYIADVVFDNSQPEIVEPRLVDILMRHKVALCQFESNSAGGHVAKWVQEQISTKGGNTHITTKWTSANKETKIIVNAPFVKEHFLFLDDSKYKKASDYGRFIANITGYTMMGKNKHDDAPDVLAQLSEYVQGMMMAKITPFARPF